MGGRMGIMPDWWPYFVAAKTCNSQPWVVAGMPETAGHSAWLEWALMREAALADAQEEIRRKDAMAAKMGRGRR